MGKFENVPELRGTENYYEWRRQTEQLLLGQGVYNHISNGTNPFDYVKYASICPCPLIPTAPTTTEREAMKTWFKDDGLAKSIILRKINSSVLTRSLRSDRRLSAVLFACADLRTSDEGRYGR